MYAVCCYQECCEATGFAYGEVWLRCVGTYCMVLHCTLYCATRSTECLLYCPMRWTVRATRVRCTEMGIVLQGTSVRAA
eukprot:731958-Rhodomonas_salina.1